MLLLAQQGSIKDKWSNIRAWFKCHTTSSSSPTSNDCTKRKLQQLLLFKRRAYNPMMNDDDDLDIRKEAEKIYRLYDLAADEIDFAEDSLGSPYYAGDRITAREAIDDLINAFMALLHRVHDTDQRSQLQLSITPKLWQLEKKYRALPVES